MRLQRRTSRASAQRTRQGLGLLAQQEQNTPRHIPDHRLKRLRLLQIVSDRANQAHQLVQLRYFRGAHDGTQRLGRGLRDRLRRHKLVPSQLILKLLDGNEREAVPQHLLNSLAHTGLSSSHTYGTASSTFRIT